jgi:Ran GTPase-activating protein (RanGAP) involved in mRNA processing and transport
MKSHRPYSSNIFKGKPLQKKLKLMKVLNNNDMPQINNTYSRTRPPTSLHLYKDKSNIFAKSNENFDLLNLMIKSSPNQYNRKKINKKIVIINPLYIRGTYENLKRPNFNENTEKVFYKYNLLYGSNTNNLIRTYSPKMRPMSSSISEFNKKMVADIGKNVLVFNDDEIMKLIKARCKDIGISLRENMIYKFTTFINSKCKNRCVDLAESHLGVHSIKIISQLIYKADRISRLNLARNNLGDLGIEILMKAIKNSMSLISLNISSNNITYKGGQIIFEDLSEQQSIIDLNISSIEGTNRNHLNYLGVINIEKFFNKNKYIEKLNLSGNSIKDEGFISICKALKDNKNLEILNISNNDIHSQGLTQGLNLITSCKITSLNLSQNKLQDTGIKILSNSLQFFPNLCKLNLSYCGFEFNGFEYLIKSLSSFKTISNLNISGNNLKSKNFEKIRSFLESNSIKNLNIAKCSLGNDSANILGDCLSNNETIRKLNISGNKISDIGFKSFVKIFSHNSNIECFDCSQNLITDASAKNLVNYIKYNQHLKKLIFSIIK